MEKDYFVPFADYGEDKFEEKLNFVSTATLLKPLWERASYETKSDFIMKYVNYVEIKKGGSKKKPEIEIISLNIITF